MIFSPTVNHAADSWATALIRSVSVVHNLVLDTSAVTDLRQINGAELAAKIGCDVADLRPGISSVALAELTAGPHAAGDPTTRGVRQALLQWAESTFDPLPFDNDAARAYGVIYAAVIAAGRKPRKRFADLLNRIGGRCQQPAASHPERGRLRRASRPSRHHLRLACAGADGRPALT